MGKGKCKFCQKEIISSDYEYMLREDLWREINAGEELKQLEKLDIEIASAGWSTVNYTQLKDEREKLRRKASNKCKGLICLDCLKEKLGREFLLEDFQLAVLLTQHNPILQRELYSQFLNEDEIDTLNKYSKVQAKIIKKHMELSKKLWEKTQC